MQTIKLKIYWKDCYIKNKIFEKWPDTVHMQRKQKKINKNILSEKIFKNKKNKLFLERLIHPIVKRIELIL